MLSLDQRKGSFLIASKTGFTLIELLVVIAVMVIISTIGIIVYGNIRADARDAKRKSELETIATVLEVNKSGGGGNYNPLVASMFGSLVFPGGVTSEALDPQGYPYCIFTGDSVIPPAVLPKDLNGVSGWDNTQGLTSCPTSPVGWSKFTGTQPASTTVSWVICTRIENQGTPGAYCRSNSQ